MFNKTGRTCIDADMNKGNIPVLKQNNNDIRKSIETHATHPSFQRKQQNNSY